MKTSVKEGTRPGFLRDMFSLHRDARAMEGEMIAELGMEPERFWSDIDGILVGYFEVKGQEQGH